MLHCDTYKIQNKFLTCVPVHMAVEALTERRRKANSPLLLGYASHRVVDLANRRKSQAPPMSF